MSIINWTYRGNDSRQLTARQIADRFAVDPTVGDHPRTVGYLDGAWYGLEWRGEFMFTNGQNTYRLAFDGELWTVSA